MTRKLKAMADHVDSYESMRRLTRSGALRREAKRKTSIILPITCLLLLIFLVSFVAILIAAKGDF